MPKNEAKAQLRFSRQRPIAVSNIASERPTMCTPRSVRVLNPAKDHNTATIRRTWGLANRLRDVRAEAPKRLASGAVSANQEDADHASRGRSSMVERQLPKLHTRVRFPSPAPALSRIWRDGFVGGFAGSVHSLASSVLMRALIAAERETYRRMIFSTDDSSHASVSAISRMVKPRTLRLEAGCQEQTRQRGFNQARPPAPP
jgi:hypothetical protein